MTKHSKHHAAGTPALYTSHHNPDPRTVNQRAFRPGHARTRLPVFALAIMFIAGIALTGPLQATAEEKFDPVAVYLTWQYNPTTSMTIDWHTTPSDGFRHFTRDSELQFKKAGDEEWRVANGSVRELPTTERLIHRVTLRGLEPGTSYRFRFGEDSRDFRFRTMPETLDEPLTFATGGDSSEDEDFGRMNRAVMEYDPAFILLGGDLAYDNGDPKRAYYLKGWFEQVKKSLIDEEGYVTPVVVTIGNHELFGVRRPLRGSYPHDAMSEEEAQSYMDRHNLWDGKPTFFFDAFAFPGRPSYNVLDFNDYLSIIALDTDHYSDIQGQQTGWLRETLAERQGHTHLIPAYHEPGYPSHRSFDGNTRVAIREHWVPLFEEFGVRVAFENHDHTYKRTHPILNGEVVADGEGIVFMGDGNWARNARTGDNRDAWYINEFRSIQHGIIVTIHEDGTQEYIAVSDQGEEFDSYVNPPAASP